MKWSHWIIFFAAFAVCVVRAEEVVVDATLAVIYHPEGNLVVLQSDLIGALDNKPKTLRELILERLMLLDARHYKITVTDDMLDRLVAQILKGNNWSRFELVSYLEGRGYSFEEGRELFRSQQMINQLLDHKIRSDSRMNVERSEAQKTYDAAPLKEEGSFTLEMAYIPFKSREGKVAYSAKEMDQFLKNKDWQPAHVVWDEPFTLKTSEVEEARFKRLQDGEVGRIVFVDKHDDGYEFTRLVAMTPDTIVPFERCFAEIVSRIRQERFAQVLEDYQNSLLKNAHITYCFPDQATKLPA